MSENESIPGRCGKMANGKDNCNFRAFMFGVLLSFVIFSLLLPPLTFFFLFMHLHFLELSFIVLAGSTGFLLSNELKYFPGCQVNLGKLSQHNHPYIPISLFFIFPLKINVHFFLKSD